MKPKPPKVTSKQKRLAKELVLSMGLDWEPNAKAVAQALAQVAHEAREEGRQIGIAEERMRSMLNGSGLSSEQLKKLVRKPRK